MFPQYDMIEVCWFHDLCLHYWSNAGKIVDCLLAYMFLCLRHTWSGLGQDQYVHSGASK